MENPEMAKRMFKTVKHTLAVKDKKIKILRLKNSRLEKRINVLKTVLNESTKNSRLNN